ncbi:hypothetical protein FRB94_014508 [Tulasnella sp. JGI-2019a]|nr:hypothetical protein FRB94_014508 [Tulasnella sp. JGI-2019a]
MNLARKIGDLQVEECPEAIGCLALRKSGGLACAAAKGFGILGHAESPSKVNIQYVSTPLTEEQKKYTRFNDGACDAKGRFWAGTLEYTTEDGIKRPGQLWRYDSSTGEAIMVDDRDLTDSNGLGWSSDHRTMYFVNSTIKVIYAYDYDLDHGLATNRRIIVDDAILGLSKDLYGKPDGLCIDKQGCIWSARWEASRVVRFTPNGKHIDLEVHIPSAYNVTACCFGGPNLDKLYITTASAFANRYYPKAENVERQKRFPCSGDLFMVDLSNLCSGDAHVLGDSRVGAGIGDVDWRYEFSL